VVDMLKSYCVRVKHPHVRQAITPAFDQLSKSADLCDACGQHVLSTFEVALKPSAALKAFAERHTEGV
jgi:hypothetical protein